ncbi:MAG: peptidyl-prolyl cis-trans isomerase [Clostridiales bacterium]|nr:peptidyl-prolyl cis-trans isomerase [Lachnospiraceae bacterium]MBP3265942.1 peptidyl-prolyl cis-trans isomerase [Clostridiales bacterium]
MKIRRYRRLIVMVLMTVFLCTACGDNKIVLTTGFAADEIFRIEGKSCSKAEVLVYLTTLHNQYEGAFGDGIWAVQVEGMPLGDTIKQTVLARLAKLKIMNLMAVQYQLQLTKEEQEAVKKAASEFYGNLSKDEIAAMDGVKKVTIEEMYEEYAIAEKLYEYLVKDVNPEISDDEARIITVHQIRMKNEAQLADIKKQIDDGEDFDTLAYSDNEAEEVSLSFAKGEMPQEIEDACFALGEGEVSEILQTEDGYVLYQCVNTYDRDQTEAHKVQILQQRRKETFQKLYDAFAEGKDIYLNEELWAQVAMPEQKTTTSDFFDIYEKYMAE